jgi:hypothetical protein
MLQVAGKIRVLEGHRPEDLPLQELLSGGAPAVLKGLVDQWELVRAGRNSDQHAMDCLRSHYNGRPIRYSYGYATPTVSRRSQVAPSTTTTSRS